MARDCAGVLPGATRRVTGECCGVVMRCTDPIAGDPVAIVTGGSSGAGRQLAFVLASRGYCVVLVYLGGQRVAEAVVDDILAANRTAVTVRADVNDDLDVQRLFDETTAEFGGVDVVVHAATSPAAAVNREAARRLRRGGAIVGMSSAADLTPELAAELLARDISVNGVPAGLEAPGADRDVVEVVALLDRWLTA